MKTITIFYLLFLCTSYVLAEPNVPAYHRADNRAPSAPVLLTPSMSAQATLPQQLFTWQRSTDPDNDPVTYTVYVGTSVNRLLPYAEMLTDNRYLFNAGTSPLNTIYYWQVVASDGRGGATASAVANFRTYQSIDTKASITLSSPDDGAEQLSLNPVLSWSASAGRTYDIYLDYGAGQMLLARDLATTRYTVAGLYGNNSLEPYTTYSWQVISKAATGVVSLSEKRKFTTGGDTQNTAPSIPTLLTPLNRTTGVEGTALLTWSGSTDSDGDDVTYTVYAGTELTALSQQITGLTSTDFMLANLQAGQTWYWKVIAADDYGNTATSETWSFTTAADATPGLYKINGIVLDEDGEPIADMALTGFPTAIRTDKAGSYAVEVPAGWGGRIHLQATGRTFLPETRDYTNVLQNYDAQNYEAQRVAAIDHAEALALSVYPNPSTGSVQIILNRQLVVPASLVVVDARGSEISRHDVAPGSTVIHWNGAGATDAVINNGIYYARLIDEGHVIAMVKLLVVK